MLMKLTPSRLGSQASLLISLYQLLWGDPRSIIERSIIERLIIDIIIIEKGFIEWYYYRLSIFSNFLSKFIKMISFPLSLSDATKNRKFSIPKNRQAISRPIFASVYGP
jgi:hypothetical protein